MFFGGGDGIHDYLGADPNINSFQFTWQKVIGPNSQMWERAGWWNQITIFVCAFFLTRPFEDQQGLREGSGRNQDRDWRVAWGKQDDAVKLEIFIWFPSKYKERHVLCSCLSPSLIWNVYHAWVVVLGEAVKTLKCRKIMSDQSIIQSLPQSNWNSVCQQKNQKRNLTFSWEIPKVHIRNGTVDSNTNRINY